MQRPVRGEPVVQGREERLRVRDVVLGCQRVARDVHLAVRAVGEVTDERPVLRLDAVDERAAVEVDQRAGPGDDCRRPGRTVTTSPPASGATDVRSRSSSGRGAAGMPSAMLRSPASVVR